MRTQKLVYVTTSDRFWPFLRGQARYMRQRGLETHAVSSPGPLLDAFATAEEARPWAISMTRTVSPLRDLIALVRLWLLFRRLRPALVHAHTPKAGLLAMLAAALAGVRCRVYTIHGLVWQTRTGWRRSLLVLLERLTCRLASRVLAVSDSIRRTSIEAGLAPADRIQVPAHGSANGLDFSRFVPRPRPDSAAPVIGFVGRLVPDKGVADLHAAWQTLRSASSELRLRLVGETEPHDPLPAGILLDLRLDPRVDWTGWADDPASHYAAMDICLLPSRREGLPYAAIEAAAMEIPVVASAVDGVTDAVLHNQTGLLVPAGDPAALAHAVGQLLADPSLRRRLGRQARRRALALYRQPPLWDAVHQHYVEALESPVLLWWKRPLDWAAALLALMTLWPLMAAVAIGVWLNLGRPILYRQRRPGLLERPFDLLKFRTMRSGPPGAPDRERLTAFGRFLRRTSLDELPQLWNILRGEMSFVGPRPLLARYLPHYRARERRRHLVRPGLTGWAQIHGRNDLAWNERLEHDAWYVDHASFGLDARIAALSLWKILARQGVRESPADFRLDLDRERQHA